MIPAGFDVDTVGEKTAIISCLNLDAELKYKVVDNPFGLSEDHLALIADEGNLCFGYRTDGSLIVIHTN